MTQREGRGPSEIAELWRERFGEPPPILTDAETMFRVLISLPPRSFAPTDEAAAPTPVVIDRFPRRRRDDFDDIDGPWPIGGEDTTS
jgi:hypothetical protein